MSLMTTRSVFRQYMRCKCTTNLLQAFNTLKEILALLTNLVLHPQTVQATEPVINDAVYKLSICYTKVICL